ncbi:relaxase/mobilization nuclease domain-containing protein [Flavobacterium sp. W1B]|uniref:relaxase/mobilization nuclease domain-containing protein n=1 Tax=Flavobacterium sp. W1B TaxID=3394146 RepID=UPI0039BD637D
MVVIIKTGHSIHGIFNYNENKVKQGVAECIGEGNYPVDVDKMNLNIKLNRLLKQASLNDNVKRHSVHISLNFDPSEITLSKEKLMDIANTYMEKIGFGQQPYLVYQHHDSGHPHIHLISIKVREDGSRIDMQNIGRNQSEIARKEIEKNFGLVVAEGRRKNQDLELRPIVTGTIQYGRIQSKKAIENVLGAVLSSYKYTSLPELNAVLKLYNVYADRGSENSRIFQAKGLVYRILDRNGKPVGVPIKASDFYNKPTLKFLEEKFIQNEHNRIPHKAKIKNAIDIILLAKKKLSIQEILKALEKEGINAILRQNSEGLLYGITYVDHRTKCVFNGSALGKQYSAKAIQQRCKLNSSGEQKIAGQTEKSRTGPQLFRSEDSQWKETSTSLAVLDLGKALGQLMQSEQASDYLPNQLKTKRKKKKRKGLSDNQ